jgi:hypothetical protein
MIRPKLVAPQITIAEDQEEFKPVTAAVVCHPTYPGSLRVVAGEQVRTNGLVLAFRLNEDERKKIAAGADLYVNLLTLNRPMQPIIVEVGPENFAAWFGVEVER